MCRPKQNKSDIERQDTKNAKIEREKCVGHRGTEDTEKYKLSFVSSLCSLCLCGQISSRNFPWRLGVLAFIRFVAGTA